MIPLRDSIRSRSFPALTVAIILANLGVFLWELGLSDAALEQAIQRYGVVPARLGAALSQGTGLPGELATLVSSMFLHGGLMHFLGNMWFLWIFGDNVEDRLGRVRFFSFYLMCGLAAAASQALLDPASQVPMIGASGAIAGVLGAYLRWYPSARVQTLVPIFILIQILEIPAAFFLGLWFLIQVLSSLGGDVGVAWWAHIFGFIAGFTLALAAGPAWPDPPPRPLPRVGRARRR